MKRNSRWFTFIPTIFAVGVLSCVFSVKAVTLNEVINEKLLNTIRDADLQAVSALLTGGVEANAKDEDGLTALMYAAMYAGANCVELLLVKGADPNAKSKADVTALMLAIGQVEKVRLLLAKGAQVNAQSKQGYTALSLAANREGSAEVIKVLLDHGAELPAINLLGAAARSGDLRVMRMLLEKGADPNDRNNLDGEAPATEKRVSIRNARPSAPQVFVPALNPGGTPLMYAALSGNTEAIKLLLAKGADVNARNKLNRTALMFAALSADSGAVKLLLEKGAAVNLTNELGYTALMYAAASESQEPEVIKALLAKGAEIDAQAKDGETALKLAGRKGRTEIVRLLKQAGAQE